MQFSSSSPEQTHQIAANLLQSLKPGTILALHGDLGAGKTTFSQGFAKALGLNNRIQSPTFNIIRQYPIPESKGVFNHLDLYRLTGGADLKSLELSEVFTETDSSTLIEWPEKILDELPEHTIHLYFTQTGEDVREITIKP